MRGTKCCSTGGELKTRVSAVLRRRLPISVWLSKYKGSDAACDLVAGLTVGLTLMPQAIAYAGLAGLPAQHGLYSAFAGQLIYVLMGTIKQVNIGPTSLMAILASGYTHGLPVEFTVLLAALAGLVELAMGLLDLGFLVDFISAPVVSGFTSATSVIIVGTQVRGLLGLRYQATSFVDLVWQAAVRCWGGEWRGGDAAVGGACLLVLLSLRRLGQGCGRPAWFVSIGRNALVVLACSVFAWWWTEGGGARAETPFRLSPEVPRGLPPVGLPPTSVVTDDGLRTYTLWQMCRRLGSALVLVPVVAVLANVAIAKSFSAGRPVDAGQEMVALGVCNMAGSLLQAMPVCGAFTRSAVAEASGVRSPLAGAYSATLILLALTHLTPYFRFIPAASLSAVLVAAVLFMVDWRTPVKLWRAGRHTDLALLGVTFVSSLWRGVEFGLLAGCCLDALRLAAPWTRPRLDVERRGGRTSLRPELGLLYPAVGRLRSAVLRQQDEHLELDCSAIIRWDWTALRGLCDMMRELPGLQLSRASPDLRRALLAAAAGEQAEEIAARLLPASSGRPSLARTDEEKPLLHPEPPLHGDGHGSLHDDLEGQYDK